MILGIASLPTPPALAAVRTGRSIVVGYGGEMVQAAGYPTATKVKVEVLRRGFVLGSQTVLSAGSIVLNHAGTEVTPPDCWAPVVPDIQVGDIVRTTYVDAQGNKVADHTVVRDVFVDAVDIGFDPDAGIITLHGHTSDLPVPGGRLNLDTTELDLGLRWKTETEDVRRSADVRSLLQPDGTWSHAFGGFTAEQVESARAAHVAKTLQVALEWAGLGEREITISGPGEAVGCDEPTSTSQPDLSAAEDSGPSQTDNITNDSNVTLRGLAGTEGPGATVKLFDGSSALKTTTADSEGIYEFSLENLKEGIYQLTAREVVDETTGAVAPPSLALELEVDHSVDAPTIANPKGLINDTTPTWTIGGEPGSSFTCKIVKATSTVQDEACGSRWTAGRLRDGDYSLHVTQRDRAGNQGETATTDDFTVDSTAPAKPVINRAPRNHTRDTTPTWRFTADEIVRCKLSHRRFVVLPWSRCGSPFRPSELTKNGFYTLKIKASDEAGNVTRTRDSFRLDTRAPGIWRAGVRPQPFRLARHGRVRIKFFVTEAATVRLRVLKNGRPINRFRTMRTRRARTMERFWSGRNDAGRLVRTGNYRVLITAVDGARNARSRSLRLRILR